MDLILKDYHVNDPTWLYLSFLLILAVYFRFNRLWSVRNLDLLLLLSISPGLLLVQLGYEEAIGYGWLFGVSGLLLVRVIYDGLITRRPRLEQNMNAAGMGFLCAATFLFLTTKLLMEPPPASTVASIRHANQLIGGSPREGAVPSGQTPSDAVSPGPGASLVTGSVAQLSKVVTSQPSPSLTNPDIVTARLIAILAHLAIIVGLTLIGRHVFADRDLGFAMAALYMLLPCTAFDVGKINHVLPAAFIVWAILAYRRPYVSGVLLGLACAMMFFPIFLLPLWAAFYGRRGGIRFGAAVAATTAAIVTSLLLISNDWQSFVRQMVGGYVDWAALQFRAGGQESGFWSSHEAAYRIPVLVTYFVMLVALTVWPQRKSLAQVITHSAAIVIGTQFWYPQQGGVYVLWYLPLLLLVLFRPLMTNHLAPEFAPLNLTRALGMHARKRRELATSTTDGGTIP